MRVDKEILEILSVATTNGTMLTLVGQLDRSMYVKVNKVLEAAGGKWNKKQKCHCFDTDASDRIDQIIISGEVEVPKDEFNYFPTPKNIVDILIKEAKLESNMTVLEPSAGQGAIAIPCALINCSVEFYEFNKNNFDKLIEKFHELHLHQSINGSNEDFLTVNPTELFNRVIMNPPFMKQNDIKHVIHAHKFLKTDGILVSVMSSSVKFRNNKLTTEFREFVENHNGYFIDLPDGSFKESGTMVNTVIVVIPN